MRISRNTRFLLAGAGGLVLLLGIAAFLVFRFWTGGERMSPRMGPVVEAVYGLGTVIAPQSFQVRAAVNQSVREVFVKEGDTVKAGAPLIAFDDAGIRSAPFAGTVTSVLLKKGEILFPATSALILVNLTDLHIEVSLEQQAVLRVQKDQKVWVSFESVRGERFEGRVQSVFPRDAQFMVRINLERFPDGTLPGMTADVAIEIGRKENVLSIPLRAVSSGRVTVRRAGRTVKETVKLGILDGQWAEVVSGNLLPDDELLVRSQ